jgi:hypothetical protein
MLLIGGGRWRTGICPTVGSTLPPWSPLSLPNTSVANYQIGELARSMVQLAFKNWPSRGSHNSCVINSKDLQFKLFTVLTLFSHFTIHISQILNPKCLIIFLNGNKCEDIFVQYALVYLSYLIISFT